MLDEVLYTLHGDILNVYGTAIDRDCDYLKLRSDSRSFVDIHSRVLTEDRLIFVHQNIVVGFHYNRRC